MQLILCKVKYVWYGRVNYGETARREYLHGGVATRKQKQRQSEAERETSEDTKRWRAR